MGHAGRGESKMNKGALAFKEIRKAKGINQKCAALLLGVSQGTISRFESGVIEITVEELQRFADVTGFDINISVSPK